MPLLSFIFRFPSKLRRRVRRSRMWTLFLLFMLIFVVIYPFYAIYKPPHLLIRYFRNRWPDVLWEIDVPAGRKVVALTIDDAPSAHTEEILWVLHENAARATFFVIGSQISDGREFLLDKLVNEGMELGNHGVKDEPARALSLKKLEKQIRGVQATIETAYTMVGKAPRFRFYRPGSGFFSDGMRSLLGDMGFKLALGSVYPHDAQVPYAWLNAKHILSMVRPGSVIVCHDRRGWTAPMLRKVLPELRRRGYEVVTLGELVDIGRAG